MSAYIELKNVTLDIPIFDINRSFRTSVFRYCTGGKIIQDARNTNKVSVRALENINIRIENGDRVGLIGHNGAGKSTLLKLLAGVYKPTHGRMRSHGIITPLFNISAGLDLDDTGEENISIVGMYLGMSPAEIALKRDNIINFSDLGDYIKLPVRTYSSGMLVRLCFAIATAIDPGILLMDEGISAGDAQFAESARRRLNEFYNRLDAMVIASHSDDLIRQLCNKAMLLEHGKIVAYGEVESVLKTYHERTHTSIA